MEIRGVSAVGSALRSHRKGHRFESGTLHSQALIFTTSAKFSGVRQHKRLGRHPIADAKKNEVGILIRAWGLSPRLSYSFLVVPLANVMKSRLFRSVLFFLLSFWLAACTQASVPTSQPLQVIYQIWPGFLPIVIAQEKGFFAQQGVQVEAHLEDSDDSTDIMIAALSSGRFDGGLVALGDAVNIFSKNPEMRVVAMTDESDGADAIVARPEVKTVKDLRGQRVGVKLGSFGELFAVEMLKANGLKPDDVELINVQPERVPDRLQAGQLQAGHTWQPYTLRSLKQGDHVIFDSSQTPGLIPDVLMFSAATLRDRSQEVKAFIRAWFQAVDYWQAHPQDGSALIAKTLKLEPQMVALEGLKLTNQANNQQKFGSREAPQSLHSMAKRYSDFSVWAGGITHPVDVDKLIDGSFLTS
jgi:NitT/TauT family transport system substrate-binding protein